MTEFDDVSEDAIRDMDKKEFRKEFPSGWMELSRYETLVIAIDALLETPASREFTVRELADKAGTTKKSLDNRIDSLVELGVITKLEQGREKPRYQLNNQSPITQKLYELNNTVNKVKQDELPKTLLGEPSEENINSVGSDSTHSRFRLSEAEVSTSPSGGGFTPSEGTG
jgi:DNA-binding transcriptional ArsR family regulator